MASRYSHQSADAGSTGIWRYSSHSSWARVHAEFWRCNLGYRLADAPVPRLLARQLLGQRFGMLEGICLDRFVELFQGLDAVVLRLAHPRHQRGLGARRAVPRRFRFGLRGLVLGGARAERHALAQLVQCCAIRRAAVNLLVLDQEIGQLALDLRGAPGVGADRGLVDAADLEAVTVLPLNQRQPEPRELLRFTQPGVRRHSEPFAPQRPAVERTPFVVCSVAALGLVQDHALDVQLRVIGPARVLQELGGHEPERVTVLAARRRVVPGAHDRSALLGHAQHLVRAGHDGRFDLRGLRFEPLRVRSALLVPGPLRRGALPGVCQGDGFLSAERHVVVRRRRPHPGAFLQPDVPFLLRSSEPAQRRYPLGDRLLDQGVSRPRLVLRRLLAAAQRYPVRPDAVVEQGPHHVLAGLVVADLAAQAERLGALARPDTGRLPIGSQVVIDADLIEVVVDIEPGRHRHLCHGLTSPAVAALVLLVSEAQREP